MFELRPYQSKAIDDILNAMKAKTLRGVCVIPTGLGKSIVIAELANALGGKIIVCQPNKELLEQNLEKYEMLTDQNPSVYCAGLGRKETDGDVIFATIQSLTRNKELFKDKIDLVIQDECHTHTNGTVFASFLKEINVKKVIGMTATPVYLTNTLQGAMLKMINRVQKGFYSKIIHVTQLEDVVDRYWAPLKYITPRDFDGRYLQLNSSGSDYTETSMKRSYEYNETHKEILSVIDKMAIKSSIIFVPSIAEAEELESMSKDIKALSSKTKTKDRKRIIEDFKSGKVKHIANCNILAIGFNYPELETVIMARPTNSLAVYYQQLGRVCRPFPGKEEAKIIDLTGNIKKFGEISKLRFEEVKPYGWGMFNGDILLTRIPLSDLERGDFIRKQDLVSGINPMKMDAEVFMDSKYGSRKQVSNRDPNIMRFGKHKGKTIDEIYMKDSGYLKWMLNNPDWDWSNMIETKNIIQEKFANY